MVFHIYPTTNPTSLFDQSKTSISKAGQSKILISQLSEIDEICLAWTLVSIINIEGVDAKDDFSFEDLDKDSFMTWGETCQEYYSFDPTNESDLEDERENESDNYQVSHAC